MKQQPIRDVSVHVPMRPETRTRLKYWAAAWSLTYDETLARMMDVLSLPGENDVDAALRLAAEHAARQPARPAD